MIGKLVHLQQVAWAKSGFLCRELDRHRAKGPRKLRCGLLFEFVLTPVARNQSSWNYQECASTCFDLPYDGGGTAHPSRHWTRTPTRRQITPVAAIQNQ